MKCPVCGNAMEEIGIEGIVLDVCKGGCGGIWFDGFELQKVDEPFESAGEKLLDIEKDETLVIDHTKRHKCPKCDDMIMMRHFFSPKKQVQVDECPNCAGIWLDAGELSQIRNQFTSEKERKKAAEHYFSEIFDVELEKMRAESQANNKKAKKIAGIFRFICPSYYIPGKQDWGAF